MIGSDYEFSGTLAFSDDELKKELHKIALNGLKAFVDSYESVYLSSITSVNNPLILVEEDLHGFSHITLGASVTDAQDLYNLTKSMKDSYDAVKTLSDIEIGNTNNVDTVSVVVAQISNVKKIADDMGDVLGFGNPKAGVITSAIGFAGTFIATFDGTTQDEHDALVKSGIDLIGEGIKLGLKAFPGVGLLGSVGIDVGVDLAVILAQNIYELNHSNNNSEDSQIMTTYIEKLNESNSDLKKLLAKKRIWLGTTDGDWHEFDGYDTGYKVLASDGNDNIRAYADNMTVYLGAGDDYIYNYRTDIRYDKDYGRHITRLWGAIGDYITVHGDDGKDTIDNGGIGCVIYTGNGNDSIRNRRENAYIDGGNGDDYIENGELDCEHNGSLVSYYGKNSTICGGDGNDTIDNNCGGILTKGTLINGGAGDDSINNHAQTSYIFGEDGNDYIYNYESFSTIVPGKGEDLIELEARTYGEYGRLIQYASGDGDDTIYGFLSTDTIQIINGNYSTLKSDNDFIISVGDGSIVLKDALADNDAKINIKDSSDNIVIYNDWSVKSGTSGNDSLINVHFNNIRIDTWTGNDYIYNWGGDLVSIYAGADNDTIENSGDLVTINAGTGDDKISFVSNTYHYSKHTEIQYANGDGNDTIYNLDSDDTLQISGAKYSTVKSGKDLKIIVGNGSILLKDVEFRGIKLNIQGTLSSDTVSTVETAKNISNTISNTIIGGTKYADTILNSVGRVTIDGGDNNDSITSIGDKVSISGGSGNDTIYSDVAGSIESGASVTIDGGMGEDYISNDSSYSRLEGKDGNDTIINYGWNTSIYGGTGNDVINNFNAFAGEGNNVLISGGAGKDSLTSTGQNDSIYGDEGNDTIYGWNSNILVDGGADNDYIYAGNYETNTSIYGGAGDDTIANFNSKSYIGGGKGNDLIYNDSQPNNVFLYESGDGNDTIYGYNANDTVKITGDEYSTVKSGNDLKISVGTGSILLKDVANTTINISGTLKGGNLDVDALLVGIKIKNSVLTASNNFTGNKIDVANYDGVTKINASNVTQGVSVIGGSENDSLKGGKGADTVFGGNGKNTLTGGNGADIFVYSGGKDIITDYKPTEDKIKLNPSAITGSTVKGSDVILTTAEGTISIKGAKDKVITFVDDSGKTTEKIFYGNMSYSPLANGLTYDTKRVVLTASNKFIGNKLDLSEYLPTVEKVNVSALSKGINVVGNPANNSVKGSSGADTISGGAGKDTILGGNGNDIINGGSDNDILKGDAGNDTLNGGTGNNTLTGGAGNDVFVYGGGNDVITDYFTGQNTIKLESGTIISATVKSSDVVLNTSIGSITVKNGKGKKITVTDGNGNTATEYYGLMNYNSDKTALTLSSAFSTSLKSADYATTVKKIDASVVSKSINVSGNSQNNTIIGSGKAETIYGSSGNDSIMGNAGNDKLFGDEGADTLSGGKGNDTLTGGDGNDVFFYANGDGNDVIVDFTAGQDSISLTSGTVTNASLKSSDVVFKIGSGTLTVKNAKNKEISIGDSVYYNNLIYDTNKTSVTLGADFSGSLKSSDYASTIKTINASGVTKSTNIVGNSQNNTIIGSSKAETIYGGSGNDSIIGNAGNDKLYGDAGNDTLLGGDGNDSLYGGLGNNTLTGGKGKDVFAYEGGNDTITDYTAGQDTIKITSRIITKTSYSGNNVIFTVGSGSITVLDGKGKKISITDSNKKTTTLTYNQDVSYMATSSNARWFTADDKNFITDEFILDSVAEIIETNYSVGQLEYMATNDELTTCDSLVSAATFVDK